MTRRDWRICAVALAALALASAGMTAWVLHKNQPEAVAAFETRFLDWARLGWSAEGALVDANEQSVALSWDANAGRPTARSALLPTQAKAVQLDVYASGTHNAAAKERWGFQAWLELEAYQGEERVGVSRMELPLENQRERYRFCSIRLDMPQGADAVRIALQATPVDGALAAGYVKLSYGELRAE